MNYCSIVRVPLSYGSDGFRFVHLRVHDHTTVEYSSRVESVRAFESNLPVGTTIMYNLTSIYMAHAQSLVPVLV
jgi:hypothetical protein